MTFGFPAYHEIEKRFKRPRPDLVRAAKRAVNSLGWKLSNSDKASLTASTSVSFWSWGEKLTVEVEDDGTVVIRSQCSLPTQCFDWGKNKKNVQRFLDEFRKELAADEPNEPGPRRRDERIRPGE
jgi:hypothetical protein